MGHLPILLRLLAVFFATVGTTWASGLAENTVIGPVHVVSMADGSVSSAQAVIIQNGIIQKITRIDSSGDRRNLIDGKNGYLIPGLAEMHAHIPSLESGEQRARDVLALYLANGITTARGMLGEPWHLQLREVLAKGDWPGPRLVTSGPSFNGRSVSSPEQAAAMVREQAAAGYDFLKLHPGLKPEEFRALSDEAGKVGIPFAGHVSFEVGLEVALSMGQATIDHLDGYAEAMVPANSELNGVAPQWFGVNLAASIDPELAPELARSTARAGVWNVPTQSLLENLTGGRSLDELMNLSGMDLVSARQKDRWKEAVNQMRQQISPENRRRFIEARRVLIRALLEADAGLLLGSDAPQIMNVPGFSIHEELRYLVMSGLTPLQALQSGTLNVARFFGEQQRGDVRVGFAADLVLLERNPLEDINHSSSIIGVMKSGQWFGRETLDAMLADIRKRGL